jgi:hypothetical protein
MKELIISFCLKKDQKKEIIVRVKKISIFITTF